MAGIIEVKDQGKVRIYDADNSNYIDIVVPSTVSSNRTITIPDASFTIPTSNTPDDDAITAAKLNNDIISGTTALTSEPADTDEFLVSDAGTIKRIDYSLIKGGGITMADQWRLTADASTGDLTSNLERVDGTNQGNLGTGMSESSGIFTFPSTGYYLVRFSAIQYKNGDRRDIQINIKTTANNSSYADISQCVTHITRSASLTTYIQGMTETLLDITDTSNQKVKFNVFTDATTLGNSVVNQTYMTFIRLGDT